MILNQLQNALTRTMEFLIFKVGCLCSTFRRALLKDICNYFRDLWFCATCDFVLISLCDLWLFVQLSVRLATSCSLSCAACDFVLILLYSFLCATCDFWLIFCATCEFSLLPFRLVTFCSLFCATCDLRLFAHSLGRLVTLHSLFCATSDYFCSFFCATCDSLLILLRLVTLCSFFCATCDTTRSSKVCWCWSQLNTALFQRESRDLWLVTRTQTHTHTRGLTCDFLQLKALRPWSR